MNRLFTTNTDADTISVVDLDAGRELSQILVGGSPRGSVRLANAQGLGYVSNCAGNTISVIDLNTLSEIRRITVGLAPRGLVLSPNGRLAFVSNSGEDNVSIVDLVSEQELRKITVGRNPRHSGITVDGGKVFVSVWGENKVVAIESPVLQILGSDPNPPDPVVLGDQIRQAVITVSEAVIGPEARPYSLCVHPGGKWVLVANTQAEFITVLDQQGLAIHKSVPVGHGSRAIVPDPDGKRVYVTVENHNEVAVVSLETFEVMERIPVGPGPRGIAINELTRTLFTSNFSRGIAVLDIDFAPVPPEDLNNTISVVDLQTRKTVDNIPVGQGPCSVAVLNS